MTKAIEDETYEFVKQQIKKSEADPEVSLSELTTNVYVDNTKRKYTLISDFIRGKLYEESVKAAGQKY